MAFGFGILDYIVVALCLAATIALLHRPEKLIVILPLMMSIDFFIPLGTFVTPGHIVPLILGGAMLVKPVAQIPRIVTSIALLYLVVLAVAVLYAVVLGGAGSRPFVRGAFYLNILLVFLYGYAVTARTGSLLPIVKGLAVAALCHAFAGFYQIVAELLNLPYRGVVYNESGYGAPIQEGASAMRINGMADEPKRMGFVVFAGAIALMLLASIDAEGKGRRFVGAGASLLAGLLTLSSSFFGAVAIWLLQFISRPHYLLIGGILLVLLTGLLFVLAPDAASQTWSSGSLLVERRMIELEYGLDNTVVYRQEFYGFDFLLQNPRELITGVGMGRYNLELFQVYGTAAGLNELGGVQTINSQLLEVGFDMGLAGVLLILVAPFILAAKMDASHTGGWWMRSIVIFLAVQAWFVNSLLFLGLTSGCALAMVLAMREIAGNQQSAPNAPRERLSA
ncbi:MAG: hypothetical protein WBA68_01815 [Alteraurantiacibacter sp.]